MKEKMTSLILKDNTKLHFWVDVRPTQDFPSILRFHVLPNFWRNHIWKLREELRQLFVLLPAIIEDGEGWVALFFLIFPKYNWQIQCSYSISLIFAFFVMFVWRVYKQKIRKTYSIPFLFWNILLNHNKIVLVKIKNQQLQYFQVLVQM